MYHVQLLHNEWLLTCKLLSISPSLTSKWWSVIVARYSEPQRHYHNLNHIYELFQLRDRIMLTYYYTNVNYSHDTSHDIRNVKIKDPALLSSCVISDGSQHCSVFLSTDTLAGNVAIDDLSYADLEQSSLMNIIGNTKFSAFDRIEVINLTIFFHDIIYDPKTKISGDNEEKSALLFEEFCNEHKQLCDDKSIIIDQTISMDLFHRVTRLIRHTKNHLSKPITAPIRGVVHPIYGECTPSDTTSTNGGGGFKKRVSGLPFVPCEETDAGLFLDMDLAILGAQRSRYEQYSQEIRSEYCHFPLLDFVNGRTKILNMFLEHLVGGRDKESEQENISIEERPTQDEREPLYKTPLFRKWFNNQTESNLVWEIDVLSKSKTDL
eukprot:Tbor_TRINITY_DN4060_c0_g1::TRINITY_DN4060_c0_g1_i1::g.11790::m.11790